MHINGVDLTIKNVWILHQIVRSIQFLYTVDVHCIHLILLCVKSDCNPMCICLYTFDKDMSRTCQYGPFREHHFTQKKNKKKVKLIVQNTSGTHVLGERT